MTNPMKVVLVAVVLAGSGLMVGLNVAAQPIRCHVSMDRGLPGPDRSPDCTPGTYQPLTRAQACKHKIRPRLSPEDRREILTEYGVPEWTGKDGELDHLQPHFLGGDTTPSNLWPERGVIPNEKDLVEFRVYDLVCSRPSRMTVRAARRVFRKDWRTTYWKWKAEGVL